MLKWDSAARFSANLFLTVFFILLFVSCATHKDVTELRGNLQELNIATESRLSAIEESVASLESIVKEQHILLMDIRAIMGDQAREQQDNLAAITARQDEINYQLRELLSTLQAIQLYGGIKTQEQEERPSSPSSLETSEEPSPPEEKIEELYKSALEDITNRNYALAESRLLQFLIQYPDHKLAGNAQYLLGEAAYGQKKYKLAIQEFDKLLKNKKYRKSPKIPASLLFKGMSQIEIGHKKSARATFKIIISSYPKSKEASIAREKIKSL